MNKNRKIPAAILPLPGDSPELPSEKRDREGYESQPCDEKEARFRERVAVWPEDSSTAYGVFGHVTVTDMDAVTGLDGLLDSFSRCLNAESAMHFRVDPSVQQRIDVLAERANEGALSPDERDEYEALINAADFISILKLKARRHLDDVSH